MDLTQKINVLNSGYVQYIGSMGSDEDIISAARMSTGKGFLGWTWEEDTWADSICFGCRTQHLLASLPIDEDRDLPVCTNCWSSDVKWIEGGSGLHLEPKLLGKEGQPRDLSLLEFLYSNRHSTPFEMGELCIEVKAPIMVFREWHR
jgi:hypothetical protein